MHVRKNATAASAASGSRTHSKRRLGWMTAVVGAVMAIVTPAVPNAHALNVVPCPVGSVVNVVAHQDDDLLFLSPDLLHDIDRGACVTTVYLTAGDAAEGEDYWKGREWGEIEAYSRMAGATGSPWYIDDAGVPGRDIQAVYMGAHPEIRLVFLRLADGFGGEGSRLYGFESLQKVRNGEVAHPHCDSNRTTCNPADPVNRSVSYSSADLVSIVGTILANSPSLTTVRTLDSRATPGDHNDHWNAARFAHDAHDTFVPAVPIIDYMGYPQDAFVANVFGNDQARKAAAFYTYGQFDSHVCAGGADCSESTVEQFPGPFDYPTYVKRQYRVGETGPRRVTIRGIGDKCMDVRGWGRADGTAVQMWSCDPVPDFFQLNQRWWFNGSEILGFSDKCLTVPNGNTDDGTHLIMQDCAGLPWQFFSRGPGGEIIGYGGKCVDVDDGRTDDAADVQIWECADVPQQKWGIDQPPPG